jgi:hypothetical protein
MIESTTVQTEGDQPQQQQIELLPFIVLKQAIQRRFNQLAAGPVYRSAVDRDLLWNTYLDSFPEGTNPMYRERCEYDCSSCRAFIKNVGGLVALVDGEIATIWDIEVGGQFQPVVDALSELVKSSGIENIYLHGDHPVSTDKNHEMRDDGEVTTWEHLFVTLTPAMKAPSKDIGTRLGETRSAFDVMLRALREITLDAVETVQDLIAQNSLYRGAEKKALVDEFARLLRAFDQLPAHSIHSEIFVWKQVVERAWVCRFQTIG